MIVDAPLARLRRRKPDADGGAWLPVGPLPAKFAAVRPPLRHPAVGWLAQGGPFVAASVLR